jgi:hypothetical protein
VLESVSWMAAAASLTPEAQDDLLAWLLKL